MYSLVLMTVMAGSGDAASFGRTLGGCYGCSGATVTRSCHGCGGYAPAAVSSCNGCTGSSCFGSCSGSCHGSRRPLFHRHSSCNGCTGSSCIGSSCMGCVGSSCYGSTTGVIFETAPMITMPPAGTTPATNTPATPATPMPKANPMPNKVGSANITIELPATAKLIVDGVAVAGTGSSRMFHTPALTPGLTYFYDMTAEVIVDGKPETQTQRVVLTSGQNLTAKFDVLIAKSNGIATAVAAK